MQRMRCAGMPALWFSWRGDKHFPLDALSTNYRAAPGARMVSLPFNMGHSHPAAWTPPDSYAFAKSIVCKGKPWCQQTGLHLDQGMVYVEFSSSKKLDRAVLISTTDIGFTGDRKWIETPAKIEQRDVGWVATSPLPAGTTAWFVNTHSGDLTASSEYQETK